MKTGDWKVATAGKTCLLRTGLDKGSVVSKDLTIKAKAKDMTSRISSRTALKCYSLTSTLQNNTVNSEIREPE